MGRQMSYLVIHRSASPSCACLANSFHLCPSFLTQIFVGYVPMFSATWGDIFKSPWFSNQQMLYGSSWDVFAYLTQRHSRRASLSLPVWNESYNKLPFINNWFCFRLCSVQLTDHFLHECYTCHFIFFSHNFMVEVCMFGHFLTYSLSKIFLYSFVLLSPSD